MNKKKAEPKFNYPFRDKAEEDSKRRGNAAGRRYISKKGTLVTIAQENFEDGVIKITLVEEAFYKLAKGDYVLSDLLACTPQGQVSTEKYLVLEYHMTNDGRMILMNPGMPGAFTEFNKNEAELLIYFYQHLNVGLDIASQEVGFKYKNAESVRQAISDINRKFSVVIPNASKKEKIISGEQGKRYNFSSYIKLRQVSTDRENH